MPKKEAPKPSIIAEPIPTPVSPSPSFEQPKSVAPKKIVEESKEARLPKKTVTTTSYGKSRVEKAPAGSRDFLPGSVSINKVVSKESVKKEEGEFFDTDSAEFKSAPPIDGKMLEVAWKELVNDFSVDKPDLRSTLASAMPALAENFVLNFEVKNQIQKDKIELSRDEIIPLLRQKLNNRFVSINVLVNAKTIVDTKPATPTEKFAHLAKKNPVMLHLQKKFGLEPEY